MTLTKKFLALLFALVLSFSITGCAAKESGKTRVVLDWTPNTNHTGMYVALEKGFYEAEGLDVELMQPPEDGALALVGAGNAEFGVDFQESLGPALASKTPVPVQAIASIVNHNTSGIVSLKESNIQSPKDLEGKNFAAWNTPLVQEIMKDIIELDGGDPSKMEMLPTTVTDIVSALQTDADAVWIFYAWDGIATEVAGLDTNYFSFAEINPVFDFYTPILVANTQYAEENPEKVKKFLAATEKGYQYAIENPQEAADILCKHVPELNPEHISRSQQYLAQQYIADAPAWGVIDAERWGRFYDWMYEHGLLESELGTTGFTNEYLPSYQD